VGTGRRTDISLVDRIRHSLETGDGSEVLVPAAIADAARVVLPAIGSDLSPAVLRDVVWLHWLRHCALLPDSDGSDIQICLELAGPLAVSSPAEVPAPVLTWLEANPGPRSALAGIGAFYATVVTNVAMTTADPDLTDLGIAGNRAAADAGGEADRPVHLFNLMLLLRRRYDLAAVEADLEHAIAAGRVVSGADPSMNVAVGYHLGMALLARFGIRGQAADLAEATSLLRAAVSSLPPGHPDHIVGQWQLGTALQIQCSLGGPLEMVDEYAGLTREILAGCAEDDPILGNALVMRCNALQTRFLRLGEAADIAESVRCGRAAVANLPPEDELHITAVLNLVAALHARFTHAQAFGPADTSDSADLAEAIELVRKADAAVPEGHPLRPEVDNTLATVLRTGRTDPAGSIRAARATLARAPADGPVRGQALLSLGTALRVQYEETGDEDLLGEAVQVLRAARAAGASGPRGRIPALLALSTMLYEQLRLADASRAAAENDIEEAIETTRLVADNLPDELLRAQQLWQLAELLRWRFDRTDQAADLDERIEALRTAVQLAPDLPSQIRCLTDFAAALRVRHSRTWDPADLNESTTVRCMIAEIRPADDPDLPAAQAEAALGLLQRFEIAPEPADLVAAERLIRSALEATAPGHPDRNRMLGVLGAVISAAAIPSGDTEKLTDVIEICRTATAPDAFVSLTLGGALMARYEHTGARADLDSAETALRAALAHTTEAGRGAVVNNLVLVLRYRFHRDGDLAGLSEAIDIGKAALRAFPAADPEGVMLAANVAAAQTDRFEMQRDSAGLTEAVDTLRSVLRRTGPDSPSLALFRIYLGSALRIRFQTMTDPADLAEATAVLRAGHASARPGDQKVMVGMMLGSVLLSHGQWSEDQEALAEATGLLRAAYDRMPAEHTGHGMAGIFLAGVLRLRFVHMGDTALLTEAIEILRDLIAITADGQVNKARALTLLGMMLSLRFDRTGDLATLTETIDVLRQAADAAGPDSGVPAGALPELANALRARHSRLRDFADLNEAVAVAERAMALPQAGPAERSISSTSLAAALFTRSAETGDPGDLNAAVELCRAAVHIPNWHAARAISLMTLGMALWLRFDRTGTVDDLNGAIDALFEAAASAPPGHTVRPVMLANLSNAFRARAGLLGSSADLDSAVDTGRSAVEAAPVDHPAAPLCLMNLGVALFIRSLETQTTGDLDAAIAAASEAAARSTPGSPNRTEILVNLAGMLRDRGKRRSDADDLDRAVALSREAVALADGAQPMFAMCLLSLSTKLRARYAHSGQDTDLAESMELARQAIDRFTAAGDPRLAFGWLTLGQLHQRKHAKSRSESDIDAAIQAYRTAAEFPAAAPMLRTGAARLWAELALRRQDWAAATEAFGVTIAQLPQVAWHGVERDARERRLTLWDGLARDSAAAALAAGDPGRAVELLEQGRSVLWSQALQTRDDLSMLRERDPALHDRLRAVAAKLATESTSDIPEAPVAIDPWSTRTRQDQDDRIKLAAQWDRLLAEARALPGLQHLLRIPPLATLRDGLPDGPVVLLNMEATRCDALIVRRDQDVEHIPLPDLSQAEATQRAEEYLHALRVLENAAGPARTGARQTLHATLEWLWDTVTGPVLTRLGYTGHDEPLPRLWWCPTGSLTLLPLHAAGYHDPADAPAGRTVIDRAVSSYTPTLRALARANAAADPVDGRVLVVSMPETPPMQGMPAAAPLPGARAEAEFLARALPGRHTSHVAENATHAEVTAGLSTHAYAHFACHGGQNLQRPSTGALYLQDKPLTVLDVAALDLAHAELAYLSACSTAVGGTALPDEAIHLAAALQLAGYRHVIATLWTIVDRTAAEVTRTMYTGLLSPSGLRLDQTARLLHSTVRTLRDSAPRNPAIWASYVHFGP
jgi:tetratricopeptide (TPR) repeat protein